MVKKYKALRLVASVYKVFGYIVLVTTILSSLGVCISGLIGGSAFNLFANRLGETLSRGGTASMAVVGVLMGLGFLIYGAIIGITLLAAGEAVYVLIDIEENTRLSAGK